MSDIGIFSTTDLWLLGGIAVSAILWPLAVFVWSVWQWSWRRGLGVAGITALIISISIWPLGLNNAETAWPIMIAWTIAPLAGAGLVCIVAERPRP